MKRWIAVLAVVLQTLGLAVAYASDLPPDEAAEELGLTLPRDVVFKPAIARELLALSREQCDRQAITKLSEELEKESFRREAADILVSFSEGCAGHEEGMRRAVNLFLDLSDYRRAVEVADRLVDTQPNNDNGYFLRAFALEKANQCEKAIVDYSSAIELLADKDKISSFAYEAISRCYEGLGQYCEAMTPIESWVAIDPVNHDNDQTRTILRRLASRGKCIQQAKGAKEERIRRKGADVVTVEAEIDGVKGTFVLDTGASYVTVKKSFADKAGLKTSSAQKIRLHTANGAVDGYLTRAGSVKMRSLEAKKVQVVVQADEEENFGNGISGLIGMSFLARYDIVMESKSIRIRPRKLR